MSESQILHIHRYAGEDDIIRVASLDDDGHKSFRNVVTGLVAPKPLAGIRIGSIDDHSTPPRVTGTSVKNAEAGMSEGWLSLVDPQPVVFACGPAGKPFAKTLTFVHASAVVFHTLDGDVTYRVTRNPGKYTAGGDLAPISAGDPTTEVFHDYRLELQEG